MTELDGTRELLEKTAGGAGWTIGWRVATRILGVLSTLILARILLPADFGLVALGMSFSRAVDILADLGVQEALVRANAPSRDVYHAAFTINAIRGGITATVLGLSAAPFAHFFGDPRLTYVVLALAGAVVLDAFENVGVADFRRNFAFRREFQLSILPRMAQVIVSVTLALTWASYWALVAGILTGRILQTIASYAMHPYRPKISLVAWREVFSFSFWTWLVGMARMIRGRGITMIVGGMLNPTLLGAYTVGAEIATLPETELIGPLCRVCFASFSAARRAGMSVAEPYVRLVSSTFVVALPACVGISSVAAPLIVVAFGAKWLQATIVIQVMAMAGVFGVWGRISQTLFSAYAYLRSLFWITVIMSLVQFLLLGIFVWYWGIAGAAIAVALALMVEQTVYAVFAVRRFAMRSSDLLRRTWRCLLATAAMTAFLASSGLGWQATAQSTSAGAGRLLLACGAGAAVYTIVLLGLWLASGRPAGAEMDLLELVRRATYRLGGMLSRRAALLWSAGSR